MIRIQPEKAKVEPARPSTTPAGAAMSLYYGKGPARHRRQFHLPPPVCRAAHPLAHPALRGRSGPRTGRRGRTEIAHDPHAEMFLISTRSEDQVRRGLAWQFWLSVFSAWRSASAASSSPTRVSIAPSRTTCPVCRRRVRLCRGVAAGLDRHGL